MLHVNPQRADDTSTRFVPVGFVAVGDDLCVRSMSASGLWYGRAIANGAGSIQARGIVRAATFRSLVYDITFHDASDADHDAIDAIDATYTKKYRLAGRSAVETATNEASHPLTVRIEPR